MRQSSDTIRSSEFSHSGNQSGAMQHFLRRVPPYLLHLQGQFLTEKSLAMPQRQNPKLRCKVSKWFIKIIETFFDKQFLRAIIADTFHE